jgi:biopolymer transport protein ExbB
MLEYLIKGKLMMGPLLACSIIAIAVIIDRIRAFRLADADSFEMRRNVSGLLDDHKLDEAIDECAKHHGPVAAVMLAGLDKLRRLAKLGRSNTEIEISVSKTMEDYAPHVLEPLEKRLNLLTLVGMISPLLGMTGTVTGMIASFGAIAQAGGSQTEAVGVGISEALITTAAGLLIALPALVAHNLLARRMDKFTLEIEETVIELNDYVSLKRGAE